MIIQINTDRNIRGDESFQRHFTTIIEDAFNRYDSILTRIEVYFSDVNGNKEGIEDILCNIEARMKSKQPCAISARGGTAGQAMTEAIDKLQTLLDTMIGRSQNY